MRNRTLILVILTTIILSCKTQKELITEEATKEINQYTQEIIEFQQELNKNYLDPQKSPLDKSEISKFEKEGGHDFFEINTDLIIIGKLDTSRVKKNIGFQTSTERIAMYDRIGIVKFEYRSRNYQLSIYESHYTRKIPEYKDHLFLPFNDLTNGETTYGGGRYLDIKKQDSDEIVLDFNKSYNPYCAYSENYSCPIPPKENYLNFEVNAGVRLNKK